MSLLKRNILANFLGSGWSAVMSILFVPLYIKFLGIEAYGLMGIFGTLQAAVSLLDMGLSPTLNRELARLSTQPNKAQEMRDLVRTLEVGYWAIGITIGIGALALAPFIAHDWVQSRQLTSDTVQQALMIMALIMTLQWPISFYSGGLMGLQRQVALNGINSSIATLRSVGSVLILWLISPTVQAFFVWQAATSALQTFSIMLLLWRRLPTTDERASIQGRVLRNIWRFAAGVSGTSVVVLVLTQLDKVILSRLLTLEVFGYYTLAGAVASNLGRLTGPVFSAIFPRLSQLVSQNDQVGLTGLYHNSCQLMSALILPLAAVATLFAQDILALWTRDPATVTNTHLLLSLMVIGTALNGIMNLPYALQLAYGWTKLAFYNNLLAVVLLVPLIVWVTIYHGAVGASVVWVMLNASYILITVPVMHTRLLRQEAWRWYYQDVGLPMIGALAATLLVRWAFPEPSSLWTASIAIIAALSLSTLTAALAMPYTRQWILQVIPTRLGLGKTT